MDDLLLLIVSALTIGFLAGMSFEKIYAASRRKYWRKHYQEQDRINQFGKEPFDPATQLHYVERAQFSVRKLLNNKEFRLFSELERICIEEELEWRVMAQVSLGEILASPCDKAFRAINSKRVDLLLVNGSGRPLHAVEYQGAGHHLGPAATRDAVKREALRKAGIGYIEVKPGDMPADLRRALIRLSNRGKTPKRGFGNAHRSGIKNDQPQ